MAINNSFFSKREPAVAGLRTSSVGSTTGSHNAVAVTPALVAPVAAPASAGASSAADAVAGGSKLTVGPNIKLKGVEITDCDTLVVEGTVEATMNSRVMHIAQPGAFHGTAEVDIAEVHGTFTGTLTVREKLVIHSTGQVSGTIRYGKIVMQEGGQLSGEVVVGIACATSNSRRVASTKAPVAAEALAA